MELYLKQGDYVPNGRGGVTRLYDEQQLLAQAVFRLTCRRGSFALLPTMGSRLYQLQRQSRSQWETLARQYCTEALADMELRVEQLVITPQAENILCISVKLCSDRGTATVEVSV